MKRITSCLLAIILCLGLFCFPVSAATREGVLDCTAFSSDQSGEGWSWSQSTKTLSLNGLEISSDADGIRLPGGSYLQLSGANSVHADGTGVLVDGFLFIKGDGSLDIVSDGVGLQGSILSLQGGAPLIRIQSQGVGVITGGKLSISDGAIHSGNGVHIGIEIEN